VRATAWVTQLRLRKTAKRSMWFSSHNVYYVKLMKYPATASQMPTFKWRFAALAAAAIGHRIWACPELASGLHPHISRARLLPGLLAIDVLFCG
jgi:hypothetical protein